jgi:hypothetical protein
MWTTRFLCSLPLVMVLGGCYGLKQVDVPRPGAEIRARLNVEAAVRRSIAAEEPRRTYDGRIVEVSGEALVLDVLIARAQSAFQDVVIRDTMRFSMSEIETVYERQISPARTALFSVGLAVGAVMVVRGVTAIVGGNTDDGSGDGGTRTAVVPLNAAIPLEAILTKLARRR